METTAGFYSLIQFCPDLSRLEAANIGVLLFCPERGFLRAITSEENSRIRKFFGPVDEGWSRIDLLKEAFDARVASEEGRIQTIEELERFIATRANEVQVTPPRPVKVKDPAADLQALFDRLVGGVERRDSTAPLRQAFSDAIAKEGLEPKVWRDVPIEVPAFGRTITIPFGYRNGRFNLIQPVRFASATETTRLDRACKYAVEGHSLYEHEDPNHGKLKLVVVGEFPSGSEGSKGKVSNLLEQYDVGMFDASDLGPLLEDIRRTGQPRPA